MLLMEYCGIEIDYIVYCCVMKFLVCGINDMGYVWYVDDFGGDGYVDMGWMGGVVLVFVLSL